jgi:hypothetical protein
LQTKKPFWNLEVAQNFQRETYMRNKLTEDDPDAAQIPAAASRTIAGPPPNNGDVLTTLRRSPPIGTDLKLARSHEAGRKVDL